MSRLSQKKLLEEGIGSVLKGVGRGALAGAGAAFDYLAPQEVKTELGRLKDIGSKIARGYTKGAGSTLKNLDKALANVGLIATGKPRGDIKKQAAVPVAKLDYDDNSGKPKAGQALKDPAIIKFEKGEYRVIKAPGVKVDLRQQRQQKQQKQQPASTPAPTPAPTPTPAPGVVTSSFSQKDLLRQLQIVRG